MYGGYRNEGSRLQVASFRKPALALSVGYKALKPETCNLYLVFSCEFISYPYRELTRIT
jgi:hypothetical protein